MSTCELSRRVGRLPATVAGIAVAVFAAGCGHPKSQALVWQRTAHLRQTAQMAVDAEEDRAERMRRTGTEFVDRVRQDAAGLPEDVRRVEDEIRSEGRRWQERQPQYLDAIRDELGGDMRHAADTLPEMLY